MRQAHLELAILPRRRDWTLPRVPCRSQTVSGLASSPSKQFSTDPSPTNLPAVHPATAPLPSDGRQEAAASHLVLLAGTEVQETDLNPRGEINAKYVPIFLGY